MRPQSAKAKGRRLQQLVVSDLLSLFEHLTEDDIRSTSMGASGEDIQMSPLARQSIPFSIEAKNQERVNVWASIEQARSNCPKDITPIVVMKKNGEQPQVVIPWRKFLNLLKPQNNSNSDKLDALKVKLNEINDIISSIH